VGINKKNLRIRDQFFNTWTPDMAYVLGLFAADGCMYQNTRGSCYLGFTSSDQQLISVVKELMGLSNNIEMRQRSSRWKTSYTLQIGSHTLFKCLLSLGFTPRKSKTLKFPEIPRKMLGHFIRGYFDGDGNVYCTTLRRRQRAYRVLTVRFISGSQAFLTSLRKSLLEENIVGSGSLYAHGAGAYILAYGTKDARQLYSFMYPSSAVPCLKRKQKIFQQAWN
jgi:hypothetical protein